MSHSLFKKGFRRRRILLFLWQASGVFGKHGMLCLGNEQVRIIDYGTMLGDILVISRRLWVMSMLVITNYSTTLNPLALPVCRLQFSMLVGAVFSNLNHSSFRGILCDQESTLLCGFSRFIGISNSLHVELLTIMHDLKLS